MPRYVQSGQNEDVFKSEYYLAFHLLKLDVFSSMEDWGDAGVFATIEWGGI